METIAIALLGFYALGYLVLAGADIGVGMLLPYLGRGAGERRLVIAAIAPFFLGNEVWLVATAGILAGAFPDLEGQLLSGLAPAVVALLVGWIVRDMGLWLRGRVDAAGWRWLCDGGIVAGSWTVALSWGWMFAGLLAGNADELATGPATPLAAVAVAALFAAHGLAFANLRLTGDPRERARAIAGRAGEGWMFVLTGVAMAALGLAAGARLSPGDMTAGSATLNFLVPTLLAVTPLLVAAQAWVWRIFLPHRVEGPSYL